MQIRYFKGIHYQEELRKEYRKLAMQYHPDINPDGLQAMKVINAEYEHLQKILPRVPREDQKGQRETSNQTGQWYQKEDGFREAINQIIFIPGIEIEICGFWVWVSGNTKPVKDQLKKAGYWWSSNKSAWYWRPAEHKSYNRGAKWSMDQIRDAYGSERVEKEEREKLVRGA
jgi:hypothetical protein